MLKKSLLLMLLMTLLAPWAAQAQRETLTFDFEDNAIPSGWTNDATYPWVTTTDAANTGTYSIKSGNAGVNSSTSSITATFTFAGDGTISFAARCSCEQNNPSYDWDYGTFSIDGVQQGTKIINSDTFTTYEYDVEAGQHTFVWKYKKDSSVGSNDDCFYLDDVIVDLGTAGAMPKPTNLILNEVTDSSVTLDWTENGTATAWQLCLNDDESNLISASEHPYTIGRLDPLTPYTVKVRSVNGSETSPWTNNISFSTTAVPEPVGDAWSDNFEGTSCGWGLVNGTLTNVWAWGTATNNGGTHSLYVSNDNGTTNAYTNSSLSVVYATKLLTFTNGKYEFMYDWMANGESSWDYLRVWLAPSTFAFTPGQLPNGATGSFSNYASYTPEGWISLDGGGKLNLSTEWQSKSVAVDVEAGTYYLVYMWCDDTSSGSQPPAAIDNVSITKIACDYDVTDLIVSNVTTDEATISWNGGEASQWQVAIKVGTDEWENFPQIQTSTTLRLTGLTENTAYQVKVRAYCGGSDYGSWSDVFSFTTACEPIAALGYEENFDSYTAGTGVLPDCWNKINTTTYSYYQGYPRINNSGSYSASNCLYFYSYAYYSSGTTTYDPQPQYAILPPMTGIGGTMVSLWAKGYNASSTFKIGTMSNPFDATTFTAIEEQALTTTYTEYEFIIPTTCTDSYIAIMIDAANQTRTSNGAYIDNIMISVANNCKAPSGLAASEITGHKAKLSWTENGEATEWVVAYTVDERTIEVNAPTNPFVLTGLDPETTYSVKVREVCEVEKWSNEITFTTDVACPTPTGLNTTEVGPFSATFNWTSDASNFNLRYRKASDYTAIWEDTFESGNLDQWTVYTEGESPNTDGWYAYNPTTGLEIEPHSGSYVASAWSWTGNVAYDADNWLVTPQLSLDGMLRFYVRTNVGYPDSYAVLLSTGGNTIDDFTITLQAMASAPTVAQWNEVLIDLSEYSGSRGYIAIHHVSDDCNYLLIDDFGLYNQVTYDWTTVTSNTNSKTISTLTDETDYEWQVQAVCGGGDGSSEWSAIATFSTPSNCAAPSELEATDITAYTATLNWTGVQNSYNVRYRTAAYKDEVYFTTFNTDDDRVGWTYNYTIYGLADPIYNIPGSENYFLEMGWTTTEEAYIISPELPDYPSGYNVEFYHFYYQYENTFQIGYSTTTDDIDAFTWSEPITAGEGYTLYSERLADGIKYIAFKATAASQEYCVFIDDFGIFSDEIPAGSWIEQTVSAQTLNIEDLTAETDYEWQVQGVNRACGDEGVTEWSESAFFTTDPSCFVPTGLDVDDITNSSAVVTWVSDATSFDLLLNGELLYENVTSPYTLEPLEAATYYRVQVRANCGGGDYSDWSSSYAFDTECNAYALPYSYDFQDATEEETDFICWDSYNIDPSNTNTATLVYDPNDETNIVFRFNSYSSASDYRQILISPELNTTNEVSVQFDYHRSNANNVETFQVGYSATNNFDDFEWGDEIEADGSTTEWSTYEGTCPAGTKYVAVLYTSNYKYYLYVDNFVFEEITPALPLSLAQGTNWVSFNVETTLDDLKAALVAALPGTNITIQSQTQKATYNGTRWTGRLSSIDVTQMYKIKVAADCELTLQGDKVNPADHPLTIIPGANWIAYELEEANAPDVVFAGFAVPGDYVKSQTQKKQYNGSRWTGRLNSLEPGQGYVYFSASSETRPFSYAADKGSKGASPRVIMRPLETKTEKIILKQELKVKY